MKIVHNILLWSCYIGCMTSSMETPSGEFWNLSLQLDILTSLFTFTCFNKLLMIFWAQINKDYDFNQRMCKSYVSF